MDRPSARFPRIITLASVLLGACGRSPAKQARDASEALQSWSATVELTEGARARGAIPERFAEQVRRAAAEERATAEARLRKARGP
jgi:hypothetical protein